MLTLGLLFILGAVIGSFLNVCIYRLPRGESIVLPASHCPACGRGLAPLDLIPLASWLALRGKCRYCGAPIAWRYPLVELLSALALPLIWVWAGGVVPPFIFYSFFILALIVIFFIDFEHQVIPDVVTWPALGIGLAYQYWLGRPALLSSLSGALVGFLLLYLIGWLGRLLFKQEAMGEGDYFLAALLGAWLGWEKLLLAVFLAYLLSAVVILPLLFWRRLKLGQRVPFGPALAAAGAVALFFGDKILAWYL